MSDCPTASSIAPNDTAADASARPLHRLDAVFFQDSLHAADGVALAVQEAADALEQVDVVGAVIAAAAAALHRLDLGETRLPEPQHMLGNVEVVGDLADGAECIRRLVQTRPSLRLAHDPEKWYGFPTRSCAKDNSVVFVAAVAGDRWPLILCLRIADGLNTITRRGEIGTSVPVFGLRPMRWPFLRTMKEPNEDSFTVSPFSRQSVISFSTNSTNADDSVRDSPTFW